MSATTISILFVLIVTVIGLRFAFTAFYRPYALARLEIIARRVASELWFEALRSETKDQEARERLFEVSKKIDVYAATIRENRIIPQDFDFCVKKFETLKIDVEGFNSLPKEKQQVFIGNLLLVFITLFALAVRYPLTLGLFFLNISFVIFLAYQWKNVAAYFYAVDVSEIAQQAMPSLTGG